MQDMETKMSMMESKMTLMQNSQGRLFKKPNKTKQNKTEKQANQKHIRWVSGVLRYHLVPGPRMLFASFILRPFQSISVM